LGLKILYVFLISLTHVPLILSSNFIHPDCIWRTVHIRSSSLCCFLHLSVVSVLLCPNILLSTLFSDTLSVRRWDNSSSYVSLTKLWWVS
jgi:hypothetical protein